MSGQRVEALGLPSLVLPSQVQELGGRWVTLTSSQPELEEAKPLPLGRVSPTSSTPGSEDPQERWIPGGMGMWGLPVVLWLHPDYGNAKPEDGKEGLTQIFGQLGRISWAAGTNLCLSPPPSSTKQSHC